MVAFGPGPRGEEALVTIRGEGRLGHSGEAVAGQATRGMGDGKSEGEASSAILDLVPPRVPAHLALP